MTAGQEFVKKIRPIGVVFFLTLFALFMYICFSSGANPIPGYEPPHDSAYYAQNVQTLTELKTELEANVFPALAGSISCRLEGGGLIIVIDKASFATTRSAIEKFYDGSLFTFVRSE
ncbi:MAG: hypothetical protein LBL15_01760 [Oscillospiraceae bacterium]|nr:hypothetical protein [Oscillospiraceae bacterium]